MIKRLLWASGFILLAVYILFQQCGFFWVWGNEYGWDNNDFHGHVKSRLLYDLFGFLQNPFWGIQSKMYTLVIAIFWPKSDNYYFFRCPQALLFYAVLFLVLVSLSALLVYRANHKRWTALGVIVLWAMTIFWELRVNVEKYLYYQPNYHGLQIHKFNATVIKALFYVTNSYNTFLYALFNPMDYVLCCLKVRSWFYAFCLLILFLLSIHYVFNPKRTWRRS